MHFHLQQLEQSTNENQAQPIFQTVHEKLEKFKVDLDYLDRLVGKEPPVRRRTARYRHEQLKFDYNSLESAVSHLQVRLTAKWRSMAEREELLTRRFKPNETQLDFEDTELLVNDKIHQSHSSIDELLAQGSAVLGSLRSQHMNIRGFRRKLLDTMQTLGLSGTTIRMIEKRLEEDWLIFLVLCVLSLIFMYAFYRYWTS